jgi:hypothetical protein
LLHLPLVGANLGKALVDVALQRDPEPTGALTHQQQRVVDG